MIRQTAITLSIPTRRGGSMLLEALRSAAPQLRAEDEICIFDNQDVPGLDLQGLGAPCPVSVVARPRVLPVRESWSAGLALGTRPWVLWLHDDDLLAPGAVDALRAVLADAGAVVLAWGQSQEFGRTPVEWLPPGTGRVTRWDSPYALCRYFLTNQHAPSGTVLRRDALLRSLPIPAAAGAILDLWLFMHLAAQGEVAILDAPIVGVRVHPSSITSHTARRAWSAAAAARRKRGAALLRELGVGPDTLRQAAADSPPEVILDTLRSLVRAREPLAGDLHRLAASLPGVDRTPGWLRATLGVRFGPLVMEAAGVVEQVLYRLGIRP